MKARRSEGGASNPLDPGEGDGTNGLQNQGISFKKKITANMAVEGACVTMEVGVWP